MKIWRDVPRVSGVSDIHKSLGKVDKTSSVASKKDVVSISNLAKDVQTVMTAVRKDPDIRQDKVNELSEKYESGNYDVNGKDMADKILKSFLDKKA